MIKNFKYLVWRISAGTVFSLVTFCGVPGAVLGQNSCEGVTAQSSQIEGAQTYTYKSIGNTDLRLHIFTPKNSRPSDRRAAAVFFFGGGWTDGSVEQFVPQSKYLASRGMVAVVADYRVRCRHNSTPFESVADAASAIRWVRLHANELGVDPVRIAAGGGSAGGQVALSAGVFENHEGAEATVSSKPNALVLFNPVIDLTSMPIRDVLSGFSTETIDRIGEISPLQHVHRGLPPTIILNGKADKIAPYSIAKNYCSAAAGLGNECRLVGYDGAGHGFFNPEVKGGKWYRPTLLEADRFLTRLGYLASPTPSAIP
jgi:acetyl esterase